MRNMTQKSTVPCQYKVGETLGSGTCAIVREVRHIETRQKYACKIINKQFMTGKEYLLRNEIAILKLISRGHPNIVTLYDRFETRRNLYLCFDLCTGGELFHRICSKGNYYEADAASLVRTILAAVKYIHDCGIVHRDLKPENLLFQTEAEDANIMIADFGLSRIMDEERMTLLTEVCGTVGYMAPEVFRDVGYGMPVDIWAMGVITYFLLAGYTPFDRDTSAAAIAAIVARDLKFEPTKYWANVSPTARELVQACLTVDPVTRPTAAEALEHKWLTAATPHFLPDPLNPTGGPTSLLPHVKRAFNTKSACTVCTTSSSRMYTNRFAEACDLSKHVLKLREESAREVLEATHHHNMQGH